ncbi:hypothetical protein C2G38_2123880 [Gigaspora rosea]|uniref:Uncharacterized protein n=1 Tax=Gigaspora rosea TaxID=44941 RepID=A0A397U7I7_9GLOM|nr:hypothetical protein C2G38_2123880 [Gigaspora rosea]
MDEMPDRATFVMLLNSLRCLVPFLIYVVLSPAAAGRLLEMVESGACSVTLNLTVWVGQKSKDRAIIILNRACSKHP